MIQLGHMVSFVLDGYTYRGIVATMEGRRCGVELRFRNGDFAKGSRFGAKLDIDRLTVLDPVPKPLPYQLSDLPCNDFPGGKRS